MFNNLVNHYLDKLTDMDRAVGQGAQLSMDDHQCADLYAHELKNLLAVSGMLGSEHSGRGRSYNDGHGGSYNMSRNAMVNGYSGDNVGELVNATTRAMASMPEDLRQEAQRFLDRVQRSQMMR